MEMTKNKEKKILTVDVMTKIAIFAAMGAVLMYFSFPLPFAPPFMSVDFADVTTLISGFALGPVAGVLTALMKNLIHLIIEGTKTAGVGEISNFIVNSSFVLVASLIYKRKKTKKNAIIGLIAGVLAMTLIATASNYFVIFPLYAKAMGQGVDAFVPMVSSVNSLVDSYIGIMAFAVIPFNLVKGGLNALVTALIYKRISSILKG